MSYSEEYKEHIEYTFAAFCKVVLRNAAMIAYRDFGRKQKREVSLDYLMSETPFEPSTMDSYFEKQDKPTIFVVQGKEVIVADERLAAALVKLSEQRRTVLLMYFFLGYTDTQIGNVYERNRSTANYWKLAALKQLRKEWEEAENEE
ncbi:sigma-70 family RNA polymerase sigma factor [Beduinella massiliensis]|uniref:sigma-70 family RNA polymerase sigma factor n=1 Tax=Beduinella massiliensis TaxID=1852363 RepID=UPI000C85242D